MKKDKKKKLKQQTKINLANKISAAILIGDNIWSAAAEHSH